MFSLQHVKKMIGIEICSEAVEDAKVNATLNGMCKLTEIHVLFLHYAMFSYFLQKTNSRCGKSKGLPS